MMSRFYFKYLYYLVKILIYVPFLCNYIPLCAVINKTRHKGTISDGVSF